MLNGLGVLVLLGVLAWALVERTDPVLRSAEALRGDRWYRLTLEDRHVGYLHTSTRRDALGRWSFVSDLRFVLTQGNPVRIEERLAFAATAPFVLLAADQRSERGASVEGTRIEQADGGYRAIRLVDGQAVGPAAGQPLDLAFALGDYLGFEAWLRGDRRPPGATVTSSALDFGRRRVVSRKFRVVGHNATGYRLENPAPLDATTIQLDQQLRPVRMTLSGMFELEQSSREQALAPRTALQAASYYVPVDRRLHDHTDMRSLTLEVDHPAAGAALWPQSMKGALLTRQANQVSTERLLGDELTETADHPISDRRVRALARRAVAGIDDDAGRVAALTHFVNRYLAYSEEAHRNVLALVDDPSGDPSGDCTEYADLLTTLARSLGIPSRTVFGLAYGDGPPPAFRFHAWNELRVDGRWLVVDPTWDQLEVDATHIPMPENSAAALELLTGGLDLSFTLRDATYD